LLDFWDDTSPETTAFALKLLVSSGPLQRAAAQGGAMAGRKHRDGDYWYSTKQTSMVIRG
jgi:hypothetical protein